MPRTISKVYIHCSYSEWGSFDDIDEWHKEKGFNAYWSPHHNRKVHCGYHFVVLNQFPTYQLLEQHVTHNDPGQLGQRLYSTRTDGKIVPGRTVDTQGAHVKGDNEYSIGICYIGITPTAVQYQALITLCLELLTQYPVLNVSDVRGHFEYYTAKNLPEQKTCPNFDMDTFRSTLDRFL